jgi:hypothetical protein
VSARCDWATIEAQVQAMKLSTVKLTCDPAARRFHGSTDNVARLTLDLAPLKPGESLAVELDDQKLDSVRWPDKGRLRLVREGDRWAVGKEAPASHKGPQRSGPFKDAFRNGMMFVYGTKGTKEENAWAYAKARYDAEVWWYRGNGAVDVIADTDFDSEPIWKGKLDGLDAEIKGLTGQIEAADQNADETKDPEKRATYLLEAQEKWNEKTQKVKERIALAAARDAERNRNVILYGHADSNAAWKALLGESPVQVRRGSVTIGDRTEKGDDLACVFVRPRPGSDVASVGVVSGTGPAGLRLTDRLAYFASGSGFPDVLVLGPEMLTRGSEGVRAAGFFGNDWGVKTGEFVWR